MNAPDPHLTPRCTICGKWATSRDIDGDWWPPCEHARTHGIATLAYPEPPADNYCSVCGCLLGVMIDRVPGTTLCVECAHDSDGFGR